jgi:transcriptional regulator with XRE-family HTH domain
MTTAKQRRQLVESLQDKDYRHDFNDESINVGLAHQIRLLQQAHGWSQKQLGEEVGMAQETISQLENPNYGRYSLSTLRRLSRAFGVALIVRFAPFSELVDWSVNLSRDRLTPPRFEHDKGLEYELAEADDRSPNVPSPDRPTRDAPQTLSASGVATEPVKLVVSHEYVSTRSSAADYRPAASMGTGAISLQTAEAHG